MQPNYIISTDLDGTLIDHHSYEFTAALPAISRCLELEVPIILNTSKTQAEVESLQNRLGLNTPYIIENGGALFWPSMANGVVSKDYRVFGATRSVALKFIAEMRQTQNWLFQGFHDWSVDEISSHTGLNANSAREASLKQFSEPLIWQNTQQALAQFTQFAKQYGLSITRGGRFLHLQGDTNKAKPLNWLIKNYELVFGKNSTVAGKSNAMKPTLIALGDNHNDIAMLNVADISVCVRSPVTGYPKLSKSDNVIQTKGFGPAGWNEAILSILRNA